MRWAIRLASSLAGIAAGLVISDVALSRFHLTITALMSATIIFWLVHIATQFMALRILIRQPSIAMAGILAVLSTIVALIITTIVVPGLSVHGISAYVFATLIIWACTAVGDAIGHHMIRQRRLDRRD